MSARKRTEQEDNSIAETINPFEPDLSLGNPTFNLTELIETCQAKLSEQDKRKIGIQDRIGKARENIARIQNMIDGLELKTQQESGQAWVNLVVRPISEELQKVFPNATIDINTVLSGAVTLTVCRKGVNHAGKLKNQECRSLTFVQSEDGIALRDWRSDTGEYPIGSIGAISGLNHPLVNVPKDSPIPFIVDWLLK